jgi:sugar lactone lactonase YvrE
MSRFVFILLLLGVVIAYLLAWPVVVQPVAWQPTPSLGYAGPHAVNNRLAGLRRLPLDGDVGPEHVAVRDIDGITWVFAAVTGSDRLSGRIVRMRPDGSGRELVVSTGGRPLGFDFDATGALVVADPLYGRHGALLQVEGLGVAAKVRVLTDNVDGDPIRYPNSVAVAADGRIYFSDSSRRFGAKAHGGTFEASVLDILEQQCSGRVLVYDPATRLTRVLMQDLCFANGVVLTADGQHLLVAETGAHRILKKGLAKDAGPAEVLLDGLPGFPDNLTRGAGGRFWVGLAKPRSPFADANADRPWIRALVMRLPRSWWPIPPPYSHVFAFDEAGRVLTDLQDASGAYPETSGATEAADRLHIHSLHDRSLGYVVRGQAGL